MSNTLDVLLAISADETEVTVTLSPEAQTVIFFALGFITDREAWKDTSDDLDEITDADWDEIEALVAQTRVELTDI